MTYKRRNRLSRSLVAAAFLTARFALSAELGLSGSVGWGGIAGPFLDASAFGALESMGQVLAGRLAAQGSATLRPGEVTDLEGAASLDAGLSAATQDFVALLELGGGFTKGALYGSPAYPLYTASADLSLGFNGFSLSASLVPGLAWYSGPEGGLSSRASLGLSFVAGDFVLKPQAAASWTSWTSGASGIELRPRLGVSWYPGFPLSLSADAGFRRTWFPTGTSLDEVPVAFSLFTAAGSLLLRLEATAVFGIEAVAFSQAELSGRLSLVLGSFAQGELLLPLGASWSLDPSRGLSLRAGLEWTLP